MIIEKHSRLPRKFTPSAPSPEPAKPVRRKHQPVPEAQRKAILDSCPERILAGDTLEEIAADHGITSRSLETWLHLLGEEYVELRKLWVANMLVKAREDLNDNSETRAATLRLARARERTRLAQWYAERRDRARYGDNPTVAVQIVPTFQVTIVAAEPQSAVQQEPIAGPVDK